MRTLKDPAENIVERKQNCEEALLSMYCYTGRVRYNAKQAGLEFSYRDTPIRSLPNIHSVPIIEMSKGFDTVRKTAFVFSSLSEHG